MMSDEILSGVHRRVGEDRVPTDSALAVYLLDPTGVITSWNAAAERLTSGSELYGAHFSSFYSDEDRAAGLTTAALGVAEQHGRFETDGWRVQENGSRLRVRVIIDAIWSGSGKLIGYAEIIRDLTERRGTDEALRLSEERFRLLVQGVHDYAIYMLDPSGQVTNWNTGAQRFKGYTEEEIVGEHFSRFYTEEDRATNLPSRALEKAKAEGRFEQEGWRVRKDGTRFWAHVVIDPIFGPDGSLLGFAKITRDVTERRDAQEALDAAKLRFHQAQKMEAIGQLTGGVAHDFNNLLAVVVSSLELARKRLAETHPARGLIDTALRAAHRGGMLTTRMLAFARRQELAAAVTSVPQLVNGMADLLRRSIGPMIEITTQFPLLIRPVFADPIQLELALLNLVVNARDAMPDGGAIAIEASDESSDGSDGLVAGQYVRLVVRDTGAGMDEDTLARAVEPFFTTKGVGKGTGLGLSMIHGFAEQSGGRLCFKSKLGEGTLVELWLPAAEVRDESPIDASPVAEIEAQPSRRILLVDDDPLVLLSTQAMLEDLGHQVFPADTGLEAIANIRDNLSIELLITDQLMPGMTGTALAERIQSERPDLPVILATGYAEAAGNFIKINKPYTQAELARAIATAFGG